jgi:hypothetical protein
LAQTNYYKYGDILHEVGPIAPRHILTAVRTQPSEAVTDRNEKSDAQSEAQKYLGDLQNTQVAHSGFVISFPFSPNAMARILAGLVVLALPESRWMLPGAS